MTAAGLLRRPRVGAAGLQSGGLGRGGVELREDPSRSDRRGEGLAQVLMSHAIEDYGSEPLLLHAQEYIAPLYVKFGFEPFGEVYVEAGIPHVSMYRA